jgi:hypothetical protein
VFRRIGDTDWHREKWRISEQIAAQSDPERYLEHLLLALREKRKPLSALQG